jgi:hypothetical protein
MWNGGSCDAFTRHSLLPGYNPCRWTALNGAKRAATARFCQFEMRKKFERQGDHQNQPPRTARQHV